MSFKIKPDKKLGINKKRSITLDGKHRDITTEFHTNDSIEIPKLLKEKNELEELKELKEKNVNGKSKNIDEIMDLKDKIIEINNKIKKLKNKKKNYYLDNSKYIFEYFENKKNISTCENIVVETNKVNDFFKLNQYRNNTNSEKVDTTKIKNKNIVQKYLCNIDESFLDMSSYVFQSDICQYCYKGELISVEDDGIVICNICFKSAPYLIDNEKPSYKEPPKEVCFYAYKKINHFKEILFQFQGKETTQLSDEVVENIKQQLKKERISLNQLTYYKTKEILKKLGYNKYYEHIAFIKNKLGIKPFTFSPELEETLCNLFVEIQSAYAKHIPDYRVNFLNYYYVLFKLCELLGETIYLEHIPLLKDREKLLEQDFIWQRMCKELNWLYLPTI